MGIWLIACNNIKKKKGNAILLFLMIAFAVMMLYVGISVLTNLYKNIDNRNALMNGADITLISSSGSSDQILNKIKTAKEVTYAEAEKALYHPDVTFYNKKTGAEKTQNKISYIFQKRDNARKLSVINIIDEGKEWTKDSIILPYYLKAGLGYKTGDVIAFEIDDNVYHFIIYGFTDDIMFSTPTNVSFERAFVDDSMYEKLAEHCKAEVTIYRTLLKAGTDQEGFQNSMVDQLKADIPGYTDAMNVALNYATMRVGTSISAMIFMGVLTVFAFLLIMIAMIIINFNINNSIEVNIKNIGILQASGYTAGQLMMTTILEVLIVGVLGMTAGLLLAGTAASMIGGIISASIGMFWSIRFDAVSGVYSILITLIMIFTAAFVGALKYKKINILDALRSGIRTHNFKRNNVNLDRTPLPLNIALGIKNVFSAKMKNVIIILIIAVLTFCCDAALSMYQNFVQDKTNLLNITGFEVPTVGITFDQSAGYSDQKIAEMENRIGTLKGIKEIKQYTSYDMTCVSTGGSEALNCDVYDNTELYVDNIVEGKNPQTDNEIMLSTVMADRLGVGTGDVVYLEMNGKRQSYIVSGLSQGINHLGKKALINLDGVRRLDKTVMPSMLYIYSTGEVSAEELIRDIKEVLSDDTITITNFEDYIAISIDSIISIMKIFSYVLILAVGFVVALVMIFLVKTQLVRDSRQYGIYKALGYTTGQLLLQTSMNYLPIVMIGTLTGCIFSGLFMNSLFVICLSMFGIRKCSMDLGAGYMLLVLVVIIIWSQLIIIANAIRIRKIVPCGMIQEI